MISPRWITDELAMFRDTVRKFVEAEIAPHEDRWRKQGHVDPALWRKAGAIGLLCTDIPSEYGGGGADFRCEAIIGEETVGRGYTAWAPLVHSILAHYILGHGTEAQKHRFLPRLASGDLIGAIAMTEPSAGSDLQGIRTRAVRDGGTYVLDGSKTFISNGSIAGLIGVVCKTSPEDRARGMSILLVETAGLEGFKVGRILDKIGQKGQDTCELFFNDVHVASENLLGEAEGHGFFQLMNDLPYERTAIGVAAVAAMETAFSITRIHVSERQAFGAPLIQMQTVRHKLAELKTQIRVARTFIDDCIERVTANTLDNETAAMAKWWLTDLQGKVMDECLQLFGGYGYMTEYPISRFYTDARIMRIYGGANEVMKELISRKL